MSIREDVQTIIELYDSNAAAVTVQNGTPTLLAGADPNRLTLRIGLVGLVPAASGAFVNVSTGPAAGNLPLGTVIEYAPTLELTYQVHGPVMQGPIYGVAAETNVPVSVLTCTRIR